MSITRKEIPIQMIMDLKSEVIETRRKWYDIFQVLK